MKLNTAEDLYQYLDRIPQFRNSGAEAARFDLERFRAFCDAIGNPQQRFPSIHVGGSNGKGSTCQILGAVYNTAGYKTGLYTSPHLIEYRERFQVNGQLIPEEELLDFFNQHGDTIEDSQLTYFELSTAIAFWWFGEQKVDLAIIEVGLGGRLDATNIIEPMVSVITNISMDHTDILGDSIGEIAREKAGIIKQDRPVVVGNVDEVAMNVIREVASLKSSDVLQARDLDPKWYSGICSLKREDRMLKYETDMISPVQKYNIATAWLVIALLKSRFPVSEEDVRAGLRRVKEVFKLPGRFEKLDPDLEWYFDGAHNIDAVQAMTDAVAERQSLGQTTLILSLMKDKISEPVMREFQKFKKIYYYRTGLKRAAKIGDIKKWLPETGVIPEKKYQQTQFFKELESELVIFAGSFYFYATVRKWLQTLHSDH